MNDILFAVEQASLHMGILRFLRDEFISICLLSIMVRGPILVSSSLGDRKEKA